MQLFIAALAFLSAVLMSDVALAQDYVLGEGDLLTISVYDNLDLTTQARVSGEDKINFPLVGAVEVGGLNIRDAEQKLAGLLADGFIVNPQVTIFVLEYHSKRVTILGEVNKPGVYELSANVTLLELISKAEGLTPDAGETILIKRNKAAGVKAPAKQAPAKQAPVEQAPPAGTPSADGMDEYISINLKDLMEKGNLALNENVQDGDNIYVSKSGVVYVTGEVNKPGAYNITAGTTVMKAIALAGGLTDIAAPNRTEVIRKENGEERTIKVDMGFIVQPDDVVSVPESFF